MILEETEAVVFRCDTAHLPPPWSRGRSQNKGGESEEEKSTDHHIQIKRSFFLYDNDNYDDVQL